MGSSLFYGREDPRDLPFYSTYEAAHYLQLPSTTLRSWVVGRYYDVKEGRKYFEPLIRLADADEGRMSFNNLVEAHVLKALRRKHRVEIQAIRMAIDYAEDQLGITRLLIRDELRTHAGDLFLDKFGELINLSKAGQLAMRGILESYLTRIERDALKLPRRLYPFIHPDRPERTIVIDPLVSFGRPILVGKGITTAVLAQRVNAGESDQELVEDYDLNEGQLMDALIYEAVA